MVSFLDYVLSPSGEVKFRILDLSNYVNPLSLKKEIFTREEIARMPNEEYTKNEDKILMQMNSIGIPTLYDVQISKMQDFINDPTVEWIWILDDSKKKHCDFCLSMSGKTFKNLADAPEIPVHENCGCRLLRCVLV